MRMRSLAPPSVVIRLAHRALPVALGACVVPSVVGKKLTKAKMAVRKAGCAVGNIRQVRRHKKAGHVLSQSPKRGTRLASHGRVNLVVAR